MSEFLAHIESLFSRHHETLIERIRHVMSDALATALQPIVDNQAQLASDIANIGSLLTTTLTDIQTEINSIQVGGTISAANMQTITNLVNGGQDAHNALLAVSQALMRADAEAKAATGGGTGDTGGTSTVSGAAAPAPVTSASPAPDDTTAG